MSPAGFAVTLQQDFIVCEHEQNIRLDVVSPELLDQARQRLQVRGAIAGVYADGDSAADFTWTGRYLLDNALEEPRRKIVDAVIAQILEHMKRNCLSGTGKSANYNQSRAV